jgi:hypothetical protein
MPVVILETVALRAPSALAIDIAASSFVTRVNGAPDRRGYVPTACRSVCTREFLPRSLRRAEAPGFEPFQLLGHGLVDDGSQIGIGGLGSQECLQPLQLPAKLRARGELDPEPHRRQLLDFGSGS